MRLPETKRTCSSGVVTTQTSKPSDATSVNVDELVRLVKASRLPHTVCYSHVICNLLGSRMNTFQHLYMLYEYIFEFM